MTKRLFLFFYIGVLGLLLGAYVPAAPAVRPLVSQVDVYCRLDGETTHMHLTGNQEMESVLGCLRASRSHIPAVGLPPSAQEDSCLIRVGLTNGKCHIYRQVSTEYFAKDSGIWKAIGPKQGSHLFTLLRTLKTQGFQGAFPVYPGILISIPKVGKFFDKTAKNIPLSFV